ncbi:uncharacterized protein LOC143021423 isoform X2 [Oratosquilla oratoria]|uniref:uncharacterized protein LOC143021423 isoform X2 n=1 Tax=Oratosquilla oratoria TaxID=337810 RepID=UPI003F76E568
MSYTQVCNYQLFVVGARRKVTENNIKRSKLSWPETPSCVTVHRRGTTRRVDRSLGVVHTALKRRSTRPPSGMRTHKYLLLLCSLIACATACSEVQFIGNGAEGHLVFSQNTVSLSYLRLNVTSKNDNVTFRVHKNDRTIWIMNFEEKEDGTRVVWDYRKHSTGWKRYNQELNFRLARPKTRLELSYVDSNPTISLYDEKKIKIKYYLEITEAQTGQFTVDVTSASNKLLLLSHCQEDRGISRDTESALNETKKGLERLENSHAEVQKELDKWREKHAESQEELVKTRKELDQAQGKLGQAQEELGQAQEELVQAKGELGQVQEELVQAKGELVQAKGELGQAQEELVQAKGELGQVQEELVQAKGELGQVQEELVQAHEEVVETQSKSTTLMATTIALGILLVIVTAAVVLVCCSPRWRKSWLGTPDTSGGGMEMATPTAQEGNPNEGFAPPGNQLERSESFESINSIYGIANPR